MDYIYTENAFVEPRARSMAAAVAAGDATGAIQLARSVPGGLNALAPDGVGVVLIAVERLDLGTLRLLLQAGANPNGGPDKAPLVVAALARDPAFMNDLLRAGANPDGTLGGETALFAVAIAGLDRTATQLLDAGATVDFPSELGETAAMAAASADQWQTALLLINRGADPAAAKETGLTIGRLAERSRLLSPRAQVEARNAVVAAWRARGLPWPPPSSQEVVQLRDQGLWPPPVPGRR